MKKISDIDPAVLAKIFRPEEPETLKREIQEDHLTPQQRALVERAAEEGTCIDIFPRSKSEND